MEKQSGFSLIELMITLVVVAIVTSIAVPSYREHVKRSHRTDAMSALMLIAAEQEKYYIQNNAYTLDLTDLGITGSLEGYYDLSVTSGDVRVEFTATASASTGGPQVSDVDCKTFTLDSTGNRTASAGATDNTELCW